MERGDHAHPVDVMEFPAQPGDRRGAPEKGLSGELSETADDLRANGRDLAFQEGTAGEHLVGLGISVSRGAALQDVADVSILTFDAGGLDDLREELACGADERQALLVFLIAGRFADEHDLRIGIAGTVDDGRAGGREFAALAVPDVGADRVEGLGGGGDRDGGGLKKRRNRDNGFRDTQGFDSDIPEELQLLNDVLIHLAIYSEVKWHNMPDASGR